MADEPIPLWEGELSGATIRPETTGDSSQAQTIHGRRANPRRQLHGACVCFSPDLASGKTEHAECPVIDISAAGLAIEYDAEIDTGMAGIISYLTLSHRPMQLSCTVQNCVPLGNGHYLLGLKLDRRLTLEERQLTRSGPGRQVAPGVRTRKLGPASV